MKAEIKGAWMRTPGFWEVAYEIADVLVGCTVCAASARQACEIAADQLRARGLI
jgi:hypothetical protein